MRQSMKFFTAIFLVILLALSSEMGPGVAEAQKCKARSQTFKGVCTSNSICSSVCKSENPDWDRGQCQGFPPKCYCVKEPCFNYIAMYEDVDLE